MIIGIDCHALGQINSGNLTYVDNLIDSIKNIDISNEYRLYLSSPEVLEKFRDYPDNFDPRVVGPHSLWIRLPYTLPKELLRNPVDVMHVNYVAPLFCPSPLVVTIHDLCWERLPKEYYTKVDRVKRRFLIYKTAHKANSVITVSNHTKRDLIDLYDIPEEKIEVIYEGIAPIFRKIDDHHDITQIRAKYNITDNFILYVGRLDKRKNLPVLMKAYSILKGIQKFMHKLVIVGEKSYLYSDIFKTVKELKIDNDVLFISKVPQEDLSLLYNAADLFVFPSLYEGFGFAPLEAMACGTPVVASNRTSIPEVVGDAGILVDPDDIENLASNIYKVLTNDTLRRELIVKGLKQVKRFSWRTTAQKTIEVYEKVYRSSVAKIGGL